MAGNSALQHIYDGIEKTVSLTTDAAGLSALLLIATTTGVGWPILACAGAAAGGSALIQFMSGRRDKEAAKEFVAEVDRGINDRLLREGIADAEAIPDDHVDPQLRLLGAIARAAAAEGEKRNTQLKAIRGVLGKNMVGMRQLTAFATRFNRELGTLKALTTQGFADLRALHAEEMHKVFSEIRRAHAPALRTPSTADDGEGGRFVYSTRSVPLFGRERELEALHAFLDDDRPLLWWLWVGDGGVGKSRLMLEFVLEAQYRHWAAGFLRMGKSFDPEKWQPTDDTLIIVDYVAERPKDVGNWIAELHDHVDAFDEHKVRFVLLERSAEDTDDWYREFRNAGTEKTELNNRRYEPPRRIRPPDDESVWEVFAHVCRQTSA